MLNNLNRGLGQPDGYPFVLSPALLSTGLVNWDLMAVALVAGALWAWSRDRPVLTGVMIGLGAATKLYPLFLLGPVLVIAWRQRRMTAFARAALGAALPRLRGPPRPAPHGARGDARGGPKAAPASLRGQTPSLLS